MKVIKRIDLPKTRDPFVNAQFVKAGRDPVNNEERFWATTWNSNSGSTGALVNLSGKNKIYRFDYEKKQFGFYGACYGGNDIMWLCGFLDEIVRLDLNSSKTVSFKTGLPHALALSGMVYDPETGKVFSKAYCQDDYSHKAFIFDSISKKTVKVFEKLPLNNTQLRYCAGKFNGKYIFINMIPGVELLSWDPKEDCVEVLMENKETEAHSSYFKVISDEKGRIYLPEFGWFDVGEKKFCPGPSAGSGICWFGRKGRYAYGSLASMLGNCTLYKWDLKEDKLHMILEIPDAMSYGFVLSDDGRIACLNMYGFYYMVDPDINGIGCSVKLDSDSLGAIDCVFRTDAGKLLLTPFISQRFLEIDTDKGTGSDLGRATGGCGEVLEICEMNGKVYMASYTKGQMTEYDPTAQTFFPENPRVVVSPPPISMRPVAMCRDSKSIYYSCSHEYGFLGSMFVKYTPAEGKSVFIDNIIENHMICAMHFADHENKIVFGTSFQADCRSCLPKDSDCYLGKIDADSLKVTGLVKVKEDYERVKYLGIFNESNYMFCLTGFSGEKAWIKVDKDSLLYDFLDICLITGKEKIIGLNYADKPGMFVIWDDNAIELWNLDKGFMVKRICESKDFYRMHVQNKEMFLLYRTYIEIYEI